MISSFLRANVLPIVYTFLFIGFLTGCSGDSDGDDTDQALAPKNLQVTTEIKGADGQNPAGDGSGEVIFKTTA